jgi:hypothetical protein
MDRRTFIHAAGVAGLSLTSRFGFGATDPAVAVLIKLLEDSPRELIPRELVRLIRGGLRYEDLLSALALAAVRNVQPYPDVGYKYHSVMMLRSIHLTTQHLQSSDKWLPIAWATNYFKETQAQERDTDGWRQNLQRLHQIPRNWKQGRNDPGARAELHAALYRVSENESGTAVIALLRQGISPEAIWQVLFGTAAELLMHQPGIVPLHAQTTANALYYAYRVCADEQTQQLTLLQCAAFIAMFRKLVNATQPDIGLEALQPLPLDGTAIEASDEIFAEVAADRRLRAARKSLSYLQTGGDAEALSAKVRHHLVYNADEPHDYKFSAAVFDSYPQLANCDWQHRFLCAGMAYFKAPAKRPGPIVEQMLERLAHLSGA